MKYEVRWVEEERAGMIIEAKSKSEALAVARCFDEQHPQVLESWDRVALGAKKFKITAKSQ